MYTREYMQNYMYRMYKRVKHSTIGSSKPKPLFLLTEAQPKLDAIEQIRADLNAEDMEVPGIVVAGAQSSGKSSLLESLSNINLPSGENITTRVPLILRLEQNSSIRERYAMIHDAPDVMNGTKVKSLDNLPQKIKEYTNNVAGNNGCVKDSPIHVKVVSHDGPTMTLIDLPGITHLSLNEQQPDIHTETVNLVRKYISNEQMIILCVVPAVDDFANSEAIKLAKSVDPKGLRTLGVVTKVDLCKSDTKISEKLRGEGNNVKLDLGFIAVRNRSPEDIQRGMSIAQLREAERIFFETSTHFIGVDRCYWGSNTLIHRISSLQMRAVDEFIPKIIDELSNKLGNSTQHYNQLEPEFTNDIQRMQHLLRIIISVVAEFKSLAKSVDDCIEDRDLHISPRTHEMYKTFSKKLRESQPDFDTEEFSEKARIAIEETKNIILFNFLSHVAFNQLFIETHMSLYRTLTEEIINNMHDYISGVLDTIITRQLEKKYPPLMDATKAVINDFLRSQRDGLSNIINNMIQSELFIFTQNTEYPIKVTSIQQSADPVTFLQKVLKIYSDISISRICDYVPMYCQLYFVSNVYKHLHEFVDLEKMSAYIVDDKEVMDKRSSIELSMKRYRNALNILNKL